MLVYPWLCREKEEKGRGRVTLVEETLSFLPSHGQDRKTAPPSSPPPEDLGRDTAPYSQDQRQHQPEVTPVHTTTDQVIHLVLRNKILLFYIDCFLASHLLRLHLLP